MYIASRDNLDKQSKCCLGVRLSGVRARFLRLGASPEIWAGICRDGGDAENALLKGKPALSDFAPKDLGESVRGSWSSSSLEGS
jgi:hypothetical protein